MTGPNTLVIAAAGSGKTTFLINEALKIKEGNVLITTYTEDNEAEIRKKIIEINKTIPSNITVQTWFSFLLQHGVRPYQGCIFKPRIKGLILVNQPSGIKYKNQRGVPVSFREDTELEQYYFSPNRKIYSDKLSKFVLRCNEASNNEVLGRLSRIYSHIFIDEVQDLAGYDLDLIQMLFKSKIATLLVGDPRQVTYLTHLEQRYSKYRNGLIKEFIVQETPKRVPYTIDEAYLGSSHRNNSDICDFASKLYPNLPASKPCECPPCRKIPTGHDGIFLIKSKDVDLYLRTYNPVQLRWDIGVTVNPAYQTYNFGKSKGLSFDRVLIYPTINMTHWLKDHTTTLATVAQAKLYVAITRARYSVGFICNAEDNVNIPGVKRYAA